LRLNKYSFVLIVVTIFSFNIFSRAYAKNNDFDYNKIILIDPGHGGFDGGAVSPRGTVEKDINLKICLKLKSKLEQEGYKVILTREDDRALYGEDKRERNKKRKDLNNRCNMKNTSNCDMFISIHLNKFPESKYYGAQVWYSENSGSAKLAHLIQENFKTDIDNTNNRVEKSAKGAYKILRSYDKMPSVIVECGFLSNASEEEKLKNDEYQNKIADSIKKSVNMYFINQ